MGRKTSKEGTRKRKEQIVNAALTCFQKNGFHKSSMQEICSLAGLSPGTVYHYFASKDAIIVHIAEREVAKSMELAAYLETIPSIEKGLCAVVDHIMKSKEYDNFQVYMEVVCEAGRNAAVSELLLKAEEIALTCIQKKLHAAHNANISSAGEEALAAYLGGQLEMLELYKRVKPSPRKCKEMAVLSKRVIAFLLSGEK